MIAAWLLAATTLFSAAVPGDLTGKIRAAETDLSVLCLGTEAADIEWTALLYLNQQYGADVSIARIAPSPLFGCLVVSTPDDQFHLAKIGRREGIGDSILADSIAARLLPGGPPDIVIIGAAVGADSAFLVGLATRLGRLSTADSVLGLPPPAIFLRTADTAQSDVILSDNELCHKYQAQLESLNRAFPDGGPANYRPQQFRRYRLVNSTASRPAGHRDFVENRPDFPLIQMIAHHVTDTALKAEAIKRLDSFRAALHEAKNEADGSKQVQHLAAAYRDISQAADLIAVSTEFVGKSQIAARFRTIRQKAYLAFTESLGLTWNSRFETRRTPSGQVTKLNLDLDLAGPAPLRMTYLKFHPKGKAAITVDSVFATIQPHQRFVRENLIDLSTIDLVGEPGDSLLFSVAGIVGEVPVELPLPYREYAEAEVGLQFLPGYTFLRPFMQSDLTSLAQSFDWQLMISKPYQSELKGRLNIQVPDGIVLGSYNPMIVMPQGTTRTYINVYLAAGRSIGFDLRRVAASLEVGGQTVAQTSADVRVVRCEIPQKRAIAFIPDPQGHLEDFLRMTKATIQPLTPHGLLRATLEAYNLIVIGTDAELYRADLRNNSLRLADFLANGGEVLVLGQSFGWPDDIFPFGLYPSKSAAPPPAKISSPDQALFGAPYDVDTTLINGLIQQSGYAFPAIVEGGREVVSAGELGSYLTVVRIGDGQVIYCGLPLLEMAERLNVDAIHLLANLLNFGHGN